MDNEWQMGLVMEGPDQDPGPALQRTKQWGTNYAPSILTMVAWSGIEVILKHQDGMDGCDVMPWC